MPLSPGRASWSGGGGNSGVYNFWPNPGGSDTAGQTRAETRNYITRKELEEFERQMNNSWDRLVEDGVDMLLDNDFKFPMEADVIFRLYYGIATNKSVLEDGIFVGTRESTLLGVGDGDTPPRDIENQRLTLYRKTKVKQPFLSHLPSSTASIREFVSAVTNRTSSMGDSYHWVDSQIGDFNYTKSRIRNIETHCRRLSIHRHNSKRVEDISWVISRSGSNNFSVYIFPAEHGSPICAGDSLFLKDHGELSQRLARISSDHWTTTTTGTISNEDMNTGNVRPKHFIISNSSESVYFFDILKAWSYYYGTQKWPDRRTNYVKAQNDAEQALVAYDNFGFLLLSITALVSSAIIAVVTLRKAPRGQLLIVLVQGIVVALFLYVLTHVLFVFLRGDDFVVDFEVQQRTVHFYQDFVVHGFFRRREAAVGKSLRIPTVLITAEVCTIITNIIVFGNIFRLFWRRKKKVAKKPKAWIGQDNSEEFPN